MTAVPPPIPPEIVERAAEALHGEVLPGCTHDEFGRDCAGVAVAAIAAVYGDIVEAARRDAAERVGAVLARVHPAQIPNEVRADLRTVLAGLRDENAPREALSATVSVRQGESGSTPVRDGSGPQIAAEGRGDE